MSSNVLDANDGEKLRIEGEVLTVQNYIELNEITDKDVEVAIKDWRQKMGNFAELVDAETI